MKKPPLLISILFKFSTIYLLSTGAAYSLSSDKDEDLEVLSDAAVLDNRDNVSIYTGNVVVNKGSIRITGERITLFYTDKKKLEKVIVEGDKASFRQLPDDTSVYDEAEANIIEYREADGLVMLSGEAIVRHDGNTLSAGRIEYDTNKNQVWVNSAPASRIDGENNNTGERVRLIIPSGNLDLSVDTD